MVRDRPIDRLVRTPLPVAPGAPLQTGSFAVREEFSDAKLPLAWMTMRGAEVSQANGELRLNAGDGIGSMGKPAFAARRQQHNAAVAETELLAPPAHGTVAGLAALQNNHHLLTIAAVRGKDGLTIRAARRSGADEPRNGVTLAERPLKASGPIRFRITVRDGRYDLAYAQRGQWATLAADVDATNLSTATAGGFVGTMIGPFAERVGG